MLFQTKIKIILLSQNKCQTQAQTSNSQSTFAEFKLTKSPQEAISSPTASEARGPSASEAKRSLSKRQRAVPKIT